MVCPSSIKDWLKSPGLRREISNPSRDSTARRKESRLKIASESPQPREDPGNVPVQRGIRLIERYAENCPRRVIPNPRQRTNLPIIPGKCPAETTDQLLRGAVQVARTAVITQSGPYSEDTIERGMREGGQGGECLEKAMEVWDDRGHLGLLKHHLGNPDGIRITGSSPWEGTRLPPEPAKQRASNRRFSEAEKMHPGSQSGIHLSLMNVKTCRAKYPVLAQSSQGEPNRGNGVI